MEDLAWLDATALAQLVRQGQVSPQELVDHATPASERLNPTLNAVIHPRLRRPAPRRRRRADGPFRGVPFLLKDILGMQAGEPYHMGLRRLKDLGIALPIDSYLTQKIQTAGFVILGRTNVPELGTLCQTESAAYGPCRNPWNPEHSTGGSSGDRRVQSRPASSPRHTRTTAAARSAFPRASADWWASSRRVAGARSARRWAPRSAVWCRTASSRAASATRPRSST